MAGLFSLLFLLPVISAEWTTLTEKRNVTVAGTKFVCNYKLVFKGDLDVDESKNSVSCKPDSKKRGKVLQSFAIKSKNVTIEHWVKKRADTIISTNVTDLPKSEAGCGQLKCKCKMSKLPMLSDAEKLSQVITRSIGSTLSRSDSTVESERQFGGGLLGGGLLGNGLLGGLGGNTGSTSGGVGGVEGMISEAMINQVTNNPDMMTNIVSSMIESGAIAKMVEHLIESGTIESSVQEMIDNGAAEKVTEELMNSDLLENMITDALKELDPEMMDKMWEEMLAEFETSEAELEEMFESMMKETFEEIGGPEMIKEVVEEIKKQEPELDCDCTPAQ